MDPVRWDSVPNRVARHLAGVAVGVVGQAGNLPARSLGDGCGRARRRKPDCPPSESGTTNEVPGPGGGGGVPEGGLGVKPPGGAAPYGQVGGRLGVRRIQRPLQVSVDGPIKGRGHTTGVAAGVVVE
jgi:hypothetical protein